ncbi:MAG: polyprenyl synthetase family protein [Candidatus Dadabacteria bacterium]|nr:MAG: polyprenyl synthetase family protein [Candidatus Dadabacteria bacterium]
MSGTTVAASAAGHPAGPTAVVADELRRVEERIAEVIVSRESRLSEISDYLINAGGKRIRPAVSLLTFRACGGEDPTDVIDLAVSLELIHTATLLHDDIIDSNDVRRGRDAAPLRFGVADTLVTGDFLFSRAFEVCGRFEPRIVAWAADACVQLTEGEIMQGRFRRNPAVTEADYYEIVRRKTASLFSACARIAAYLAGAPPALVDDLARAGLEVGIAFQMIDDVLDVEGDPRKIGKRVGTDLVDGNPSLPVIKGLALPPVHEAFTSVPCPSEAIKAAVEALKAAGIPAAVREQAVEHARAAAAVIATLPPSAYRDSLATLVEDLVGRQF